MIDYTMKGLPFVITRYRNRLEVEILPLYKTKASTLYWIRLLIAICFVWSGARTSLGMLTVILNAPISFVRIGVSLAIVLLWLAISIWLFYLPIYRLFLRTSLEKFHHHWVITQRLGPIYWKNTYPDSEISDWRIIEPSLAEKFGLRMMDEQYTLSYRSQEKMQVLLPYSDFHLLNHLLSEITQPLTPDESS
ncbi:MAG TPA: hypothetical protein PK299_03010 [Anaerolineales bacterium]|nr:hypothetical protein [Anaerolineales bacterium]